MSVHVHLHGSATVAKAKDATEFGTKVVTKAVFEQKTRAGEWEAMTDINKFGRVEVKLSSGKRETITVRDAKDDANSDYENLCQRVDSALEKVKQRMKVHKTHQKTEPKSYGYVGDMGEVLRHLEEAARVLG